MQLAQNTILGIIREGKGSAVMILKALDVDLDALRKVVESSIINNRKVNNLLYNNLELKKQAARAVKLAHLELMVFKGFEIKTIHLLLSMLKDEDSIVTISLKQFNIDYETVKNEFASMIDIHNEEFDEENSDYKTTTLKLN